MHALSGRPAGFAAACPQSLGSSVARAGSPASRYSYAPSRAELVAQLLGELLGVRDLRGAAELAGTAEGSATAARPAVRAGKRSCE